LLRAPTEFGPPVAEWNMSDADHFRFGRFTGDYNGIHLWDWYARRLGFARALYHPPRVLGQCLAQLRASRLVPNEVDRQRLDVWLKGPVSHGAHVRLHAVVTATSDVASPSTTFGLFADEDRPCIVGRWQATSATATTTTGLGA
jgi:acyl dehydratase